MKLNEEVPVLPIEAGMTLDATDMVCAICDGIRDVSPAITEIMMISIYEMVTQSTEQFLKKQSADTYCQSLSTKVGTPWSVY